MNISLFAKELNVEEKQISKVDILLQEGATLPFIARYRKDYTGGLTDVELEKISEFLSLKKAFDHRRKSIQENLEKQ